MAGTAAGIPLWQQKLQSNAALNRSRGEAYNQGQIPGSGGQPMQPGQQFPPQYPGTQGGDDSFFTGAGQMIGGMPNVFADAFSAGSGQAQQFGGTAMTGQQQGGWKAGDTEGGFPAGQGFPGGAGQSWPQSPLAGQGETTIPNFGGQQQGAQGIVSGAGPGRGGSDHVSMSGAQPNWGMPSGPNVSLRHDPPPGYPSRSGPVGGGQQQGIDSFGMTVNPAQGGMEGVWGPGEAEFARGGYEPSAGGTGGGMPPGGYPGNPGYAGGNMPNIGGEQPGGAGGDPMMTAFGGGQQGMFNTGSGPGDMRGGPQGFLAGQNDMPGMGTGMDQPGIGGPGMDSPGMGGMTGGMSDPGGGGVAGGPWLGWEQNRPPGTGPFAPLQDRNRPPLGPPPGQPGDPVATNRRDATGAPIGGPGGAQMGFPQPGQEPGQVSSGSQMEQAPGGPGGSLQAAFTAPGTGGFGGPGMPADPGGGRPDEDPPVQPQQPGGGEWPPKIKGIHEWRPRRNKAGEIVGYNGFSEYGTVINDAVIGAHPPGGGTGVSAPPMGEIAGEQPGQLGDPMGGQMMGQMMGQLAEQPDQLGDPMAGQMVGGMPQQDGMPGMPVGDGMPEDPGGVPDWKREGTFDPNRWEQLPDGTFRQKQPGGIKQNLNEYEMGPDGKWRKKTALGDGRPDEGDPMMDQIGGQQQLGDPMMGDGMGQLGDPMGGMDGPGMGMPGMDQPGMGDPMGGDMGGDMGGLTWDEHQEALDEQRHGVSKEEWRDLGYEEEPEWWRSTAKTGHLAPKGGKGNRTPIADKLWSDLMKEWSDSPYSSEPSPHIKRDPPTYGGEAPAGTFDVGTGFSPGTSERRAFDEEKAQKPPHLRKGGEPGSPWPPGWDPAEKNPYNSNREPEKARAWTLERVQRANKLFADAGWSQEKRRHIGDGGYILADSEPTGTDGKYNHTWVTRSGKVVKGERLSQPQGSGGSEWYRRHGKSRSAGDVTKYDLQTINQEWSPKGVPNHSGKGFMNAEGRPLNQTDWEYVGDGQWRDKAGRQYDFGLTPVEAFPPKGPVGGRTFNHLTGKWSQPSEEISSRTRASLAESLRRFPGGDINGDGILTAEEKATPIYNGKPGQPPGPGPHIYAGGGWWHIGSKGQKGSWEIHLEKQEKKKRKEAAGRDPARSGFLQRVNHIIARNKALNDSKRWGRYQGSPEATGALIPRDLGPEDYPSKKWGQDQQPADPVMDQIGGQQPAQGGDPMMGQLGMPDMGGQQQLGDPMAGQMGGQMGLPDIGGQQPALGDPMMGMPGMGGQQGQAGQRPEQPDEWGIPEKDWDEQVAGQAGQAEGAIDGYVPINIGGRPHMLSPEGNAIPRDKFMAGSRTGGIQGGIQGGAGTFGAGAAAGQPLQQDTERSGLTLGGGTVDDQGVQRDRDGRITGGVPQQGGQAVDWSDSAHRQVLGSYYGGKSGTPWLPVQRRLELATEGEGGKNKEAISELTYSFLKEWDGEKWVQKHTMEIDRQSDRLVFRDMNGNEVPPPGGPNSVWAKIANPAGPGKQTFAGLDEDKKNLINEFLPHVWAHKKAQAKAAAAGKDMRDTPEGKAASNAIFARIDAFSNSAFTSNPSAKQSMQQAMNDWFDGKHISSSGSSQGPGTAEGRGYRSDGTPMEAKPGSLDDQKGFDEFFRKTIAALIGGKGGPAVQQPVDQQPVDQQPVGDPTGGTYVPGLTPGLGGEETEVGPGTTVQGGVTQPGQVQPGQDQPVEQPGGDVAPGGAGGHEPVAHSDKRRTYDQWGGWRDEQLINGEWVEVSRGVGHEPGPGVDQPGVDQPGVDQPGVDQPGQDPGQPGDVAPGPGTVTPGPGTVTPGVTDPFIADTTTPPVGSDANQEAINGWIQKLINAGWNLDDAWRVATEITQKDVNAPIYGGDMLQRMVNQASAQQRKSLKYETEKGMGRGISTGAGMVHQFGLPEMAASFGLRRSAMQQMPYLAEMENVRRRAQMGGARHQEALGWANLLRQQWYNQQQMNLALQGINQQGYFNRLNQFGPLFQSILG